MGGVWGCVRNECEVKEVKCRKPYCPIGLQVVWIATYWLSKRRFALLTLLDTSLSLLLEPRGFCMYTSADATESSAAAIIHRIDAVIWMSICSKIFRWSFGKWVKTRIDSETN